MKELKFRGLSNNTWVYGFLSANLSIEPNIYFIDTGFSEDPTYVVEKSTIGQFTGLTDKNGKEIYTGDIIQYKHYYANKRWWSTTEEIPVIEKEVQMQRDDYSLYKSEVRFDNGCFKLKWDLNFEDVARGEKFIKGSTHSSNFEEKSWDFEVIGNIHQSKELIKN